MSDRDNFGHDTTTDEVLEGIDLTSDAQDTRWFAAADVNRDGHVAQHGARRGSSRRDP